MSSNNDKYDFTGKVVLVTGSSSGIGAAIAIQFAQYGANVVITGRSEAKLGSIAKLIRKTSTSTTELLKIIGDLRDDTFANDLISKTIEKYGQLDVLVNNAGGSTPNATLANPNLLQEFDFVMKLNLRSVVQLTQLAVPFLEKSKGNIVNISSVASTSPFTLGYSTSKAALDMVTKCSALELGPKGIRVNSINPGLVVTSIYESRGWTKEAIDDFYGAMSGDSLLGRIGSPGDIANLACFLASDDARNITGSIMVSDSGFLIRPPKIDTMSLSAQK